MQSLLRLIPRPHSSALVHTRSSSTLPSAPKRGPMVTGVPSSAGVYKGRACVLNDLFEAEGRMKQGDVLVIKHADAHWNELIMIAGALVIEAGGRISHGPMMARQLGIPCVSELGLTMWDHINDGQTVFVNGNAGTVEALPKDE